MASDGAPDDHDVMEIGAEEYDLEDDEDVSGEGELPWSRVAAAAPGASGL